MADTDITITYRWDITYIDGTFYVDEFCSMERGFVRYGPVESRSKAADMVGLRKIELAELQARLRRCKDTLAYCGVDTEENVDVVFV